MPDRLLLPIAVLAIFGLALLAARDTCAEIRHLGRGTLGPVCRWCSILSVRWPSLTIRSLLGFATIFAVIAMLARFAGPIALLALLPGSPLLARVAWRLWAPRFSYDWKAFTAKALATGFLAWLFASSFSYAGAVLVVAVDFTLVAAAEAVVPPE